MIFALFIIASMIIILRIPVVKGFIGELIVKLIIGKTSEKAKNEKFVINNFLIQLESGKTSQTDHILINKNGVFVIETKNYSGRVYGNDTQKEWTQVLNYGKVKNHFYSPVKQNAAHVHHIKNLLPPETPIYSIVVFVKGNKSFIKSKYVYTLWGLIRVVKKKSSISLSSNEIKTLGTILAKHNKSHIITNAEHVQHIRNNQNKIANHICPRCKGTLLTRHGKQGTFLGCANYPKCRFTKKL